jgi:hypothetical protein
LFFNTDFEIYEKYDIITKIKNIPNYNNIIFFTNRILLLNKYKKFNFDKDGNIITDLTKIDDYNMWSNLLFFPQIDENDKERVINEIKKNYQAFKSGTKSKKLTWDQIKILNSTIKQSTQVTKETCKQRTKRLAEFKNLKKNLLIIINEKFHYEKLIDKYIDFKNFNLNIDDSNYIEIFNKEKYLIDSFNDINFEFKDNEIENDLENIAKNIIKLRDELNNISPKLEVLKTDLDNYSKRYNSVIPNYSGSVNSNHLNVFTFILVV